MAGVQLTGLASGFDWKSLVDQMIQLESTPVTRLQAEQTQIGQQTSALNTLQSKLQALQQSTASLKDTTAFSQRTASVGNALWSVAATPAAAASTHNIAVSHLATTSHLEGASDISSAIRSDGDASQVLISAMNLAKPVTAGQFTVNGARVSIAITDTLEEVFQKIGVATGGAVTAAYDGTTDRITLSGSSPIVLGSANDSSNFLQAFKLSNNGSGTVESTAPLGTAKLDAPLSAAGLSGTFSGLDAGNVGKLLINGAEISFDTDTDSLRTVIARINASSAGVSASYDATKDRLILTNKITGDLGVSVRDGTGNLASVLGLDSSATVIRGRDAEFTVDGGATRTSSSNTLDEDALGVAGLSLTVGSETTERISVGTDTASARAKIEDFIAKFNDIQAYIEQQTKTTSSGTKVTTSVLTGNRGVNELARTLHREAFKAFSGGSGGIQRLDSLGIDFNGTTGRLAVKDSAKLDQALSSKGGDVTRFFSTMSSGFSARFDEVINHQIGTDGSLVRDMAAKSLRSTKITSQISDLQRRLDLQRQSLTARFTQMEQIQSQLQTQLQSLTKSFSQTSSS